MLAVETGDDYHLVSNAAHAAACTAVADASVQARSLFSAACENRCCAVACETCCRRICRNSEV